MPREKFAGMIASVLSDLKALMRMQVRQPSNFISTMPTYFDTITSFVDAPIDAEGKISTPEFLESAKAVVGLFDLLGSSAFGPVKSDIQGNIVVCRKWLVSLIFAQKVENKYKENPELNKNLQDLVRMEWNSTKTRTATEGLLWLRRGLDFVCTSVGLTLASPNKELKETFTEGYKKTLSQYHNFLVRPIFSMAMSACPYRADFFKKLGDDQAEVNTKATAWVAALQKHIKILDDFFKKSSPVYENGPFS